MADRPLASALDALLPGELNNTMGTSNRRLIRMRWVAGGLVLVATALGVHWLGLPLPEGRLYAVGAVLLAYNTLLAWLTTRLNRLPGGARSRSLNRLIPLQVVLDWLTMAIFLHLTGGISSPAMPFFLIHMLMVSILQPGQSPYLYVVMGTALLGLIAVLEPLGVLPHYHVIPGLSEELYRSPFWIGAQLFFLLITGLATANLTISVMDRLRQRERQLMAVLSSTQAVTSTLSLPDVMERLAQAAADALTMPGAAIRLLDESGERLLMTAAVGLSQSYLEKGDVKLRSSRLDEEALAGQPVVVADAASDRRLQYPEQVVAEGIRSLLVVPIVGHGRPLGVLRVYADRPAAFTPADGDLVLAIARQGAAALENAIAHEALQRTDAARGDFVRIVTHELRSPVGGAQSLIRTMARGLAGELTPSQQDIINRVETRLDHLQHLTDDLLALAASKTPDLQDPATRLPLQSSLKLCVERWRPQAEEKNVKLTYSGPPEMLAVRGTEEGLCRIFDNLIGNAVKYTPTGGTVTVRGVERMDNVVITIADTGMGIPADDLPNLWEEFYRASNARGSTIPGTGLGLSIVKRLVEAMGGTVGVRSEEGVGTTFKVTLPLLGPGDSI